MADPWDGFPIVEPVQPGVNPWEQFPMASNSPLQQAIGQTARAIGSNAMMGPILAPLAMAADKADIGGPVKDIANKAVDWMATRMVGTGANTLGTQRQGDDILEAVRQYIAKQGGVDASKLPPMINPLNPVGSVARMVSPGLYDWMSPDAGRLKAAATQAGAPDVNMPQGPLKMLDVGAEAALAAPLFGGGAKTLFPAFTGGVGSEGAGQLAHGMGASPFWESMARIAGGVGGGALGAGAQALIPAPNAETMLKARVKQYTPQELADAADLQQKAKAMGIPLMPAEAADARPTGPLAQLSSVTQTRAEGRPILTMAEQRLKKMPGVIEGEMGKIGPRVEDAAKVSSDVGEAARKSVVAPQNARAAAARPSFTAAADDLISPQVKADALQSLTDAQKGALPGGPVDKLIGAIRADMQNVSTVGMGDQLFKKYEAIAKSGAFNGDPIPDDVRVNLKPILQSFRSDLSLTNPSYAKGMSYYDKTAPETQAVTAAKASPAATMAAAQKNPATEGAIGAFDKWLKNEQSADAIKRQIASLNKQDPQAARDALRLVLQRDADQAFAKSVAGGEPMLSSGGRFAARVAPTEQGSKNIRAAVEAVTGGNKTTAEGFMRLLDISAKTNIIPGIGSQTEPRLSIAKEAGRSVGGNLAQAANVTQGSFLRTMRDWNEMRASSKTWADLANVLSDPEGVKKLQALALAPKRGPQAAAIAASILSATAPQQGQPAQ